MTTSDPRERQAESWRRFAVGSLTMVAGTLPFSHVPAQLGLALAFIGWIGWSVSGRRVMIVRDRILVAAMVYWGWNVLASALSVRPTHSLAALVDNEWPALLGLLIWWTIRSEEELRRLLVTYFAASSVAFIYGIIQTFSGMEWIKGIQLYQAIPGYARAVGFSGFPLTFAGFAMTVFFLAGAFALERPSSRIRWVVPVLAVGAILASFARSIWLSTAVLLFVTAMLATAGPMRRWALAAGAFVIVAVLSVAPLRERAMASLDLSQQETRMNVWRTAASMVQAYPVFGIGQDNFTYHFETFRVDGYYETFVHPHNDYLSVLVHGGFVALAGFVTLWVLVLRRGVGAWREQRKGFAAWIALGGTVGLTGFLVSSMFQNYYGTFVNCFNWWLVVGCILVCYKLQSQPIPTDSKTG